MAIRNIRTLGDSILIKECKPVKEINAKTLTLIEDMLDTMYETNGVGLAAPQIGVLKHTMRFGPLKPVGLRDPKTGHRPWAVLQLRKENSAGSMFNLVGFQTNLKFPEQKRVFSMIPALKNADFVRYGVMHRNTFIESPRLLNGDFSFRQRENLFFAGQITGVEGYMESASSGIMAGLNMVRKLQGKETLVLPETSMIGALSRYISDESVKNFQPMGANFGVLPPIEPKIRDKQERYAALSARGLKDLQEYLQGRL